MDWVLLAKRKVAKTIYYRNPMGEHKRPFWGVKETVGKKSPRGVLQGRGATFIAAPGRTECFVYKKAISGRFSRVLRHVCTKYQVSAGTKHAGVNYILLFEVRRFRTYGVYVYLTSLHTREPAPHPMTPRPCRDLFYE